MRAEALVLLAELEGLDRAVTLLEEALREAEARPALQAAIHTQLAWTTRFKQGFVSALDHARTALGLADELDDNRLRLEALDMASFLGAAVGDPEVPAYAARAEEIAIALDDPELLGRARSAAGVSLSLLRDVDALRALCEEDYREWRDRDEPRAADALYALSTVELWAGRWDLAADYAARAQETKLQYGLEVPWDHLPIAIIAAHRGQLELARAHSERGLRLGQEQIGLHTPVHLATLGLVAFQGGDLVTAVEWFGKSEAQTTRLGWGEPSNRWWVPDHVEALLELGRLDDAVPLLDRWEADARRLGRDWLLADVTRCRGLVAAAQGAVDEAATLLGRAAAGHGARGDRYGAARSLLALGVVCRRMRQKRAAREAIAAALADFERLGAQTWSEKARAELGRIGGRRREPGLTAAERRVAALVAEGRTNREVAAALFLGERTVETHLSHVYAKLGVRSRAELARTFRGDEQSSGELTISS
jgi:DNA-binding CsgD family transcriptional regulator